MLTLAYIKELLMKVTKLTRKRDWIVCQAPTFNVI